MTAGNNILQVVSLTAGILTVCLIQEMKLNCEYCVGSILKHKLRWLSVKTPQGPLPHSLRTHPGLGQLFDLLHLFVRHDIVVSDNPRPIPLVFLLHRANHEPRVVVVVIVTAEEAALPAQSLTERNDCCSVEQIYSVNVFVSLLTILRPLPRHSCSYVFLSGR